MEAFITECPKQSSSKKNKIKHSVLVVFDMFMDFITEINTKEHSNRQNVNICITNLDTNKERETESNWTFLKGNCIEEF